MQHPSRRRIRALTATFAIAVAALASALTGSLSTSASAAPATVHKTWALTRPACAQPTDPAVFRCYAITTQDVPAGTPGAVPATSSAAATGPVGGLSPTDLGRLYSYSRWTTAGSTQTVAIVDWYDDPYVLRNLDHFDAHYGFHAETSTSFRKVNETGRTAPLPAFNSTHDNRIEINLDVQTVRSVCARCRILLVEADRPSDTDLAAAVDTAARLGATEISNSWGGPENQAGSKLRSAFKHPGVVITASTGDDGWYGWDFSNYGDPRNIPTDNGPSFPSSSPYVVAVGGTSVSLGAGGRRASEWVWNANGPASSAGRAYQDRLGASGGGCSRTYAAPGWQGHDQAAGFSYSSLGCGADRSSTDVAAVADDRTGLSVYYSAKSAGRWIRVGGTSFSSPLIAAMYALAGGSGGSAYPAASLYVNALRAPTSRYDVTLGANGFCGQNSTTHVAYSPAACVQATQNITFGETNNPNAIYPSPRQLLDCSFSHLGTAVVTPPSTPQAQCTATAGFDGPTGVGTPTGLRLFADTSPGATVTGPSSVTHKHTAAFSATIRPISGARVSAVSWYFGDGKSSLNAATHATHSYAKAGRYKVTMVAEDSLYQQVFRSRYITVR